MNWNTTHFIVLYAFIFALGLRGCVQERGSERQFQIMLDESAANARASDGAISVARLALMRAADTNSAVSQLELETVFHSGDIAVLQCDRIGPDTLRCSLKK